MKDSGVAWIGEMPAGWGISRNKDVISYEKKLVSNGGVEDDLLTMGKGGVRFRDKNNNKGKFPANFDTYQLVEPGDFVFCLFDVAETPCTVGLSPINGMITGAYDVFRSFGDVEREYLKYFFASVDQRKAYQPLYGGMRNVITKEKFGGAQMALPPLPEQRAIAAYLDRETSLIDQEIALIERKVALLAEYRKAVIFEAVTKGLNKGAAMKDSGVAWLGEIPEGWAVGRVSMLCHKVSAGEPAPSVAEPMIDGMTPFVRVSDLSKNHGPTIETVRDGVPVGTVKIWPENTVVFPKSGESIRSGLRKKLGHGQAVVSHLACLVPKEKNDYLFWLSHSFSFEEELTQTSLPALGLGVISRKPVPIPPVHEQRAIAAHLDRETSIIDQEIAIIERKAALLSEYRKALIFEAVTGKIEVPSL